MPVPQPTAASTGSLTPESGGGGGAGLANYEATLGKLLGSKLYEAVSKVLTYESLQSSAKGVVDSTAKALAGKIGNIDGVSSDPAALSALGDMLADAAGPEAAQWMKKNGPALSSKLQGWVDANPEAIAGLAVLAAAGAVIANVPIPKLAQKFQITKGLNAEVEVALGRVRSIALEKIQARLAYQSGPLSAAVLVTQENGQTTGKVNAGTTVGGVEVNAAGTFTDKGLQVAGVGAAMQTSAGKLSGKVEQRRGEGTISSVTLVGQEGDTTKTNKVSYDSSKGTLTVGQDALVAVGGGHKLGASTSSSSDGSSDASMNYAYSNKNLDAKLDVSSHTDPYSMTQQARVAAGLNYKVDDLKLALDAEFGSGKSSASGSVERDFGGGHRAGASLSAGFGTGSSLNVGAFYGFKDPETFRQFLVQYSYKSEIDEHQLKALLEGKWEQLRYRLQASATNDPSGTKLGFSAHGALPLDQNTLGVAGFNVLHDPLHDHAQIMPEVGVQHKGVQVLFGFDPNAKSGTIRLGIPF